MREHRAFARVATTEQEESAQAPLVRRSERGTSDPPPPHPAPPSKQTDEYQSASSPSTQHEKPRDILLLLLLLLSSQVPPVEPAAATTAPVCCAPTPAPARRQQQRRLQDAPVRLVVVCVSDMSCPAERPFLRRDESRRKTKPGLSRERLRPTFACGVESAKRLPAELRFLSLNSIRLVCGPSPSVGSPRSGQPASLLCERPARASAPTISVASAIARRLAGRRTLRC